jgi:hypothetical protein
MSYDYYAEKRIQVTDLFWQKMKRHGIKNMKSKNSDDGQKCLVGKTGCLWMWLDEYSVISSFTRYGTCEHIADDIYNAIVAEFGSDFLMCEEEWVDMFYAPAIEQMNKVKAAQKRARMRLIPKDIVMNSFIQQLLEDTRTLAEESTAARGQARTCLERIAKKDAELREARGDILPF